MSPAGRPVVVTGMGCLSGLGQGVDATWAALASGADAMRPFERRKADGWIADVAGQAAWMDPPDPARFAARFNPQLLGQMDACGVYAVLAAFEALEDASLLDHPDIIAGAAALIGCGGGGLTSLEQSYVRLVERPGASLHPLTVARQMPSAPASQVSMVFGARGPTFAIASACASSSHAIAEGAEMIASGRVDIAIVGGAEAPLSAGCWLAWKGLRVMAKARCRPFSAGRDGLMLGEGAAVLILESEDHAAARGARPRGRILGHGASADAHHITQPDGVGAAAALTAALARADIATPRPALISSHGTGTTTNDAMETRALRAALGDALDDSLVIATKSAHGHLLGAGAALELVIGLLALEARQAPPVLGYLGPDPACALPLALAGMWPADYDLLVSNAFAFGGLNSVIVAGRG
jgi:nodulation protein E